MEKTPDFLPPGYPANMGRQGAVAWPTTPPSNGPHGEICITLMIKEAPLTFHGVFL